MFRKGSLDNGIPVVMERMGSFRSVSLGIWVSAGSRYESPEKNGISHFLEHMFFKGTEKRSAKDIAVEIDSLGGELNAFTTKEGTTFYIKVLDEHLHKGLDLLSDIFMNSTFPPEEIRRERGVISEEISMTEDSPEDYVHDLFCQNVWGDEGLGQTVLGKVETINKFRKSDLLGHIRSHYGTNKTVISCAGKFDNKAVLERLNGLFGRSGMGSVSTESKTPEFKSNVSVTTKDLSEVHICLGVQGIRQSSPDRYCMLVLNTILGGGISSRLFQEIREKRGLAYSVYSFLLSYMDTGLWGVYAGTGKKSANEVIERVLREFRGISRKISEDDLQRAKDQIKGNIMLGLESTSRRMQNIANQQIYYGRYFSPQSIIKEIDAVSLKKSRQMAEKMIKGKHFSVSVLGPVEREDIEI